MDDILVYSKTYHENLEHVRQVNQEGFKLKLKKFVFAKNEIKYLGRITKNNT